MQKFNAKIYVPLLVGTTVVFGLLAVFINPRYFLGVIGVMPIFIYITNRSKEIEKYCISVDLDTNMQGDVIEVYMLAFNTRTHQYYPIMTHYKQLRIFVNIKLLDNFYSNIGYQIEDEPNYGIRKVLNSETADIAICKKQYKKFIADLNQSYKFSVGSMQDTNLTQPQIQQTNPGLLGKVWNWWTFNIRNG